MVTPGASATSEPDSVLLRRLSLTQTPRNEVMEIKPESSEDGVQIRLTRTVNAIAGALTQIAASTAEEQAGAAGGGYQNQGAVCLYHAARTGGYAGIGPHCAGGTTTRVACDCIKDMRGTIYLEGDKAALEGALVKKGIIVTDHSGDWTLSTR